MFDVAGDDDRSDIRRSQIDLYFVWLLAGGRNWLIVDPQIVLDHEAGKELGLIEAELGFMIAPTEGRFPTDQGFDEWYGIPNSSDESAWTELDGYAESGVEGTFIYEGKKGETPSGGDGPLVPAA